MMIILLLLLIFFLGKSYRFIIIDYWFFEFEGIRTYGISRIFRGGGNKNKCAP